MIIDSDIQRPKEELF